MLLGSSPIASPRLLHKHAGSEDPSLHRHYPASTVLRSSPTPVWPAMLATALGRARPQQVSPDNPHCLASVLCPLPRRIGTGACVRLPSLFRAAFPVTQAGRHPHRYFRGLFRLYSRYGPLARSAAQGGLCHKAPACSVAQTSCSSATRSNRLLSRWNLPPLATRAYGAHWAKARDASQPRDGSPPSKHQGAASAAKSALTPILFTRIAERIYISSGLMRPHRSSVLH